MDAESWLWVWLAAAVLLALAELFTPFLFFMISFAFGAALAALAAFLDAGLAVQWVLFIVGSSAALLVLVPIGRRMARAEADTEPEGAHRWIGRTAVVLEAIPGGPHATGLVRLERAEWRAEAPGTAEIEAGQTVRVVEVKGTRLIVVPTSAEPLKYRLGR
jgi:membrane protein implicated in regulation of membrane protease activity